MNLSVPAGIGGGVTHGAVVRRSGMIAATAGSLQEKQ